MDQMDKNTVPAKDQLKDSGSVFFTNTEGRGKRILFVGNSITLHGIRPEIADKAHAVVQGIGEDWPKLLGYNRLIAKEGSEVPMTINGDPLIALGRYGKGRTCAYATDCAPHWSPVDFCTCPGYKKLWGNLVDWLTER